MGCTSNKADTTQALTLKPVTREGLLVQPGMFVQTNKQQFQEVYQLGRLLGSGNFGEVRKCVHRQNCVERAVKIFRKDCLTDAVVKQKMLQETSILKHLDHPNIVRVYECFDDHRRHYIVMENCEGGEVFDELIKRQSFTEHEAAQIMKQLLSAVAYLHQHQVTHRDLKPENILLEDRSGSLRIKLVDFGTATYYERNSTLKGSQGTPYYVAPEVLQGCYTEKCDTWACGVILYILLSGSPPFDGRTDDDILDSVRRGVFTFPGSQWTTASTSVKDLIVSLLCPESTRLTATEALNHEWIARYSQPVTIEQTRMSAILGNLKTFQSTSKLRDAVSTYIATQCVSATDTAELRDVFTKIDTNGDGKLSREELLQQFLQNMGHLEAEEEVKRIMEEVDTDNNGFIDYTEFIKASMDTRKVMSVENLRIAFNLFDKDNSGSISVPELKEVLQAGIKSSKKIWKQIMSEVDQNGDGEIDFHEFEELLLRNIGEAV